jgi:hypothetical protein
VKLRQAVLVLNDEHGNATTHRCLRVAKTLALHLLLRLPTRKRRAYLAPLLKQVLGFVNADAGIA